jgi:ABC-type glycerol-3-phosphate transport system substrate-binding protein
MWAMSYQGDYAPMLMPAFTAATGIPVEVQSVPWTAAHEKLLTAFAGGTLPDVLMLPNGWINEFAMIGAIAPVMQTDLIADVFPGVASTARVQGKDYAVPWSVAPQVQFYRRDILADAGYGAPPETWDGWRTMARALKRRRPDNDVFLMLLNWPDALFTMLGQAGATMLRDRDTRSNFRTPEAREAFAFYLSLFADGFAPRTLSTEVQDPVAAFAQGLFAIWPSSATTVFDFTRRRGEIPAKLWGTARVAGPHGPGPTSALDISLCVSARSRRPADAWALIRHATSSANELRFQRLIGVLPARVDAWRDPQLDNPVLAPFATQIQDTIVMPLIPEWERIRIEVQIVAERMVRGLASLEDGLAAIDVRVDHILTKRRALVQAGRIA